MSDSSPTDQTLTCEPCGFVNEVERVYCHNCGAKLDRSFLPQEDDEETKAALEKTRKRVKNASLFANNPVTRELKVGIKVLVAAAIIALGFQASQPPEGLPDPKAMNDKMVGSDITEALDAQGPRQLIFSEKDINALLRSKKAASALPGVVFVRAFAQLEPGVCRMGMQHTLWTYPVYTRIAYKLEIKEGKFTPTIVGGNFGSISIPAPVMNFLDYGFQKLWGSLKREQEWMNKLSAIVIEKEKIMLVTTGVR